MSKERFLLYLLAGIFLYQAVLFTYGFHKCTTIKPELEIKEVCPDIRETYSQTFTVMISTTLALLTGSAINKGE